MDLRDDLIDLLVGCIGGESSSVYIADLLLEKYDIVEKSKPVFERWCVIYRDDFGSRNSRFFDNPFDADDYFDYMKNLSYSGGYQGTINDLHVNGLNVKTQTWEQIR